MTILSIVLIPRNAAIGETQQDERIGRLRQKEESMEAC
jgi:hypothetical protein